MKLAVLSANNKFTNLIICHFKWFILFDFVILSGLLFLTLSFWVTLFDLWTWLNSQWVVCSSFQTISVLISKAKKPWNKGFYRIWIIFKLLQKVLAKSKFDSFKANLILSKQKTKAKSRESFPKGESCFEQSSCWVKINKANGTIIPNICPKAVIDKPSSCFLDWRGEPRPKKNKAPELFIFVETLSFICK